jgi:hypothetical protein
MTTFTRGMVATKPRPLRLVRDSCLTPLSDAVLDYASELDRTLLEIHVIARAWDAQIVWRRQGKPMTPVEVKTELGPTFEGLVARGYLELTTEGYALTPAGEVAATERMRGAI